MRAAADDSTLPPPPAVDCSVLVPVLNEARHLEAALASMRAQRFDGSLEFVFVDDGSTDATRAILERAARRDPRIRLLDNPRSRTASALNAGLRQARGTWVARMDAHARYPPDYLARGVERLRRGDTPWVSGPALPVGAGVVSRAVCLAVGSPLGRAGSRKWSAVAGTGEYELDSGVFAGVWRRRDLVEIGGWDERWPRNQDSELAGRFQARGQRLVCLPEMAAEYVPRDSLVALWRQYRGYGSYRVATARRHPHTMRPAHLAGPALALAALAAAGPRLPVRAPARAAVGLYAGALVREAVRARRRRASAGDALAVPAVLAAMHLGHGVGALTGLARFGVPWAAVGHLLGVRARRAPAADPVFAPSLHGG